MLIVSRTGHPGWRLMFDQPVDPAIRALLPRPARYGSWIDRIGLAKASAMLGGRRRGRAVRRLFGAGLAGAVRARELGTQSRHRHRRRLRRQCLPRSGRDLGAEAHGGAGRASGSGRQPIAMTLIDVGIFNAAALPGQQIVIFDGALREAENPDAMAGILAHEIAHVRRRHVTQALIRELGIGALIRLFAGRHRRQRPATGVAELHPRQ